MLHKLSDFEKALDYIGCFVVKYNRIGYEQGSALIIPETERINNAEDNRRTYKRRQRATA